MHNETFRIKVNNLFILYCIYILEYLSLEYYCTISLSIKLLTLPLKNLYLYHKKPFVDTSHLDLTHTKYKLSTTLVRENEWDL
jgi:hypothetical protein